jgi:ribosome modulation factor
VDTPTPGPSRVGALRVGSAGQAAARAGKSADSCPYPADGDAGTRFLRRYWLRGFNGESGQPDSARP